MSREDAKQETIIVRANPVRKRYGPAANQLPAELACDPKLATAISALPANYNFEIHKTIWRLRKTEAKRVALQFPDGLLMFACIISDIIEQFTDSDTIIMGDATYGACCVDDYSSHALSCDFLVHYGHSCLIPIDRMPGMKLLYVFVDIKIDIDHFVSTLKENFKKSDKILLVSTVQFVVALHVAKKKLEEEDYIVTVPQAKPLSPGEILGCTSPSVAKCKSDAVIFLGDGRFHLESIMISNPEIASYKYDPYSKGFTLEEYDHLTMQKIRKNAIAAASTASTWGIIIGTLGRQGSPEILKYLEQQLLSSGKEVVKVLLSEIFPSKLKLFQDVKCWVQIACPRLSIDWGLAFDRPLLTPYEAVVALNVTPMWTDKYPMDFYAHESSGPWNPNYGAQQRKMSVTNSRSRKPKIAC